MTEAEAKERAERCATTFPHWNEFSLSKKLVILNELSREFQRIAQECEWQKEPLYDAQTKLSGIKELLANAISYLKD